MKKSSLAAALLLSLVALSVNAAQNATTIGFQGKLLDNNNNPENGSFTMKFSIYNGAGTSLWGPESQTVTVNNGVFAVQLGAVSALTPAVFASSPTYVGVTVGSDPEMTPRQELGAAPYALSAAQLVQNGSISINAGTSYSTYTTAGNLIIDNGIIASSADIQGNITASSGNFTLTGNSQFSLEASSGILVDSGTLQANGPSGAVILYGLSAGSATISTMLTAATGSFTGAGAQVNSITTSSGIAMAAGTLLLDGQAPLSGVAGGLLTTSATLTGGGGAAFSLTTSSGIFVSSGTFLVGPSADAIGAAPRVAQSSSTTSTTIAATAAPGTLIAGSQITIYPTSPGKLIYVRGTIYVTVATANTEYGLTLAIYRQVNGACSTTSTEVNVTPTLEFYAAETYIDYPVVIDWIDNPPDAAGQYDQYCLTAYSSTASKFKTAFVQMVAILGHP